MRYFCIAMLLLRGRRGRLGRWPTTGLGSELAPWARAGVRRQAWSRGRVRSWASRLRRRDVPERRERIGGRRRALDVAPVATQRQRPLQAGSGLLAASCPLVARRQAGQQERLTERVAVAADPVDRVARRLDALVEPPEVAVHHGEAGARSDLPRGHVGPERRVVRVPVRLSGRLQFARAA